MTANSEKVPVLKGIAQPEMPEVTTNVVLPRFVTP